jgi:D-3-phosphoglycerate dehydrogenase / 2-oxoglutarate reductase
VTDFPTEANKGHPKVIALPHLGASTREAEENCAIMVADNLRDFLENGNIRHSVNFPDAILPRIEGSTRLAIANANVPNMVGQISTALASAGLNISDLLNKSRGDCRVHAGRRRRQGARQRARADRLDCRRAVVAGDAGHRRDAP